MFEIRGTDLEEGVIPAGADLICEYAVRDCGHMDMEVSVPAVRGSFASHRNFYSHQEGQIDYTNAGQRLVAEAQLAQERLTQIAVRVEDARLDEARARLERAADGETREGDPERAKSAMDDVHEARRLMAMIRKEHIKDIRQIELDGYVELFDDHIRANARASEALSFDNLVITAQRAIDSNNPDFETRLREMRGKGAAILWRQDWFIIDRFTFRANEPHFFADAREHAQLVEQGAQALDGNDMDRLREIVFRLDTIRLGTADERDMLAGANILKG